MKKYNTIRVEKKEEALSMEADKINQAQQDLTYTQQQKGELTRRRNWEKRMEQKRLAALKAEKEEKEQLRTDERFMREAIRQAHKAAALGDVPIGCVIVRQGQIIARGYNRRNADKSVLSHAEIISMKKACKKLGDWRLEDCTMYVTLEPCPMCTGAIINARIRRLCYGAKDPKAGSCGSIVNLFELPYNHKPQVISGVLEEACAERLSGFFRSLRERKKNGER